MASAVNVPKYSLAQLKEILRGKNLLTTGNKADLILRLQEQAPDALCEAGDEGAAGTDDEQRVEQNVAIEGFSPGGIHAEEFSTRNELEFVRRERDLLRRELALL